MSSNTRRRQPRVQYDGRSYGSGRPDRKPERKGPNVRQEAAEQALNEVLELFADPDRLPAAIAETLIARQEGSSPMVNWSLPNQLLCVLAGSLDCRGIRQWNEAGRQVRKGARCVRILAPRTRKIREQDPSSGEESERVVTVGFLGIPVFRVEDTEGAPLEVPSYEPASFPPLYEAAERLGVRVDYAPGGAGARFRGAYQPSQQRIVLLTHDAVTFLHELAHAAHDRVLRARGAALTGGQVASQEVVAEVVAATLCKLYGLDGYLAGCRTYVEHYAERTGAAKAALRVLADVQAVLLEILEAATEPAATAAELVAA